MPSLALSKRMAQGKLESKIMSSKVILSKAVSNEVLPHWRPRTSQASSLELEPCGLSPGRARSRLPSALRAEGWPQANLTLTSLRRGAACTSHKVVSGKVASNEVLPHWRPRVSSLEPHVARTISKYLGKIFYDRFHMLMYIV